MRFIGQILLLAVPTYSCKLGKSYSTPPLNQATLRVIWRILHRAADFLNPDVTMYSDLKTSIKIPRPCYIGDVVQHS